MAKELSKCRNCGSEESEFIDGFVACVVCGGLIFDDSPKAW